MSFPYKLIDLTHSLDSTIPTWNGDCGFNHNLHVDYTDCQGEDKFRVMKIKMNAGIGTHVDAPSHCIPGGRCIDDFNLDEMCMPAIIIDVSDRCHARFSLAKSDIIEFENKHGQINKSTCVMINTGWSKFWDTPTKYHNNHIFPYISNQAAELLLKRDINALGIDTLSPDIPQNGFPVHRLFLGAGKILIENATNLKRMPQVGSYVMVLPIKVKDGTEAPVRLVGLIKK
ncbi:MAG: cyclase family protein [Alphaproteobacteria bacterium]|nr:cyclase family protein [Alphaproteobacteria bacterium]OJV16112.1 MAG: cyclase [Alphaproteobacteria bacterium 33-17]